MDASKSIPHISIDAAMIDAIRERSARKAAA
jgi:hypothetical protein